MTPRRNDPIHAAEVQASRDALTAILRKARRGALRLHTGPAPDIDPKGRGLRDLLMAYAQPGNERKFAQAIRPLLIAAELPTRTEEAEREG